MCRGEECSEGVCDFCYVRRLDKQEAKEELKSAERKKGGRRSEKRVVGLSSAAANEDK